MSWFDRIWKIWWGICLRPEIEKMFSRNTCRLSSSTFRGRVFKNATWSWQSVINSTKIDELKIWAIGQVNGDDWLTLEISVLFKFSLLCFDKFEGFSFNVGCLIQLLFSLGSFRRGCTFVLCSSILFLFNSFVLRLRQLLVWIVSCLDFLGFTRLIKAWLWVVSGQRPDEVIGKEWFLVHHEARRWSSQSHELTLQGQGWLLV